ncbi:MAG: ribosome-binding factor A [Patescibacteria group bacterium]|mgnify:CR=1 FL=1
MKTPIKFKDEKQTSLLAKFAAEYFLVESNKDSLLTITKAEILNKGKRAIIYFTVLPIEKEEATLEFAKRRCNDFRQFVMSKKSFGFVPRIEFCIDAGEHNRQRIDELLNEHQ